MRKAKALKPSEMQIVHLILEIGGKGGLVSIKNKQIAQVIHRHPDVVKWSLQSLETKGYIKRFKFDHSRYLMVQIPQPVQSWTFTGIVQGL